MPSVKTKFVVGLFVAVGFFLAAVAIIWLGMSHYFEKGHFCVAYFDESVQGLSKDSPVKYRGVAVGRVYRLGVAPDATLIEAVLQIDPKIVKPSEMVARLKNVGITGSMFIDLDRKKKGDEGLSPKIRFKAPYPVIATRPSQIKEFLGDVRDILTNFKKLDLEKLATQISETLEQIRKTVREAHLPEVSQSLRTVIQQAAPLLDEKKWDPLLTSFADAARALKSFGDAASQTAGAATNGVAEFRRLLAENRPQVTVALAELRSVLDSVHRLLGRGDELLQQSDVRFANLQYHLVETLNNVNQATLALNHFLDLIADQPSQLFFGEPPPPRSPGQENRGP